MRKMNKKRVGFRIQKLSPKRPLMPGDRKYRLHDEKRKLPFEVVSIVGACRSGKTTLGRLLGSFKSVEYIDEPWLPMMLPVIHGKKLISSEVCRDIFSAYLQEFFYDVVLLRQANFRPNDLSSIWSFKEPVEIFDRLTRLDRKRDAANYARDNRSLLLYSGPGTYPFLKSNKFLLPEGKIVHIIRNGVDVALDVAEKKWYSDESLMQPFESVLSFAFDSRELKRRYYLPWWIEDGEEEYFLSMNNFTRGLYYWRKMNELVDGDNIEDFKIKSDSYTLIRFEELLKDPSNKVHFFEKWLNRPATGKTTALFKALEKIRPRSQDKVFFEHIPEEEVEKVNFWLEKYDYPQL